MKAAGIEVVRIAEFAWTVFEPRENKFSFSLFDAFMDLALEEDMKVIFCTPHGHPARLDEPPLPRNSQYG